MSKKNSLEAKALRRVNKSRDRGFPSYWTVTEPSIPMGYTKLAPYSKTSNTKDPLMVALRGFMMNHWFKLLGLDKEVAIVKSETI